MKSKLSKTKSFFSKQKINPVKSKRGQDFLGFSLWGRVFKKIPKILSTFFLNLLLDPPCLKNHCSKEFILVFLKQSELKFC